MRSVSAAVPTRAWSIAVATLVLALGLGSCGEPDPEQAAREMQAMKQAVNAEVRDIAAVLSDSGLSVHGAQGRVESLGMSTYAAEDYQASAFVVGKGSEADQVDQAATALEATGWSRTSGDLDAADPWAQLQRNGFRTTISWTAYGERELLLSLDQDGEVEVPTDTDIVDRNNSEDIPLG